MLRSVELDGDEMTRVIWDVIKKKVFMYAVQYRDLMLTGHSSSIRTKHPLLQLAQTRINRELQLFGC